MTRDFNQCERGAVRAFGPVVSGAARISVPSFRALLVR